MNTTINVNLAGQHFYFDQAAKVKLEIALKKSNLISLMKASYRSS